jgi:uncharacterized protein YycO
MRPPHAITIRERNALRVTEKGTAMSDVLVIDVSKLLPGDIVLSTGKNKVSWMIRAVTGGDYSHAALHVGHGIAVEANDPGVVPVFLPAVSYEANTRVHVRRLRGLPPEKQSQLVDFVWEVLYRPYSTRGAIGSVWQKLRQQSDPGYFCSQLAAAAYEKIKSPIADCEAARCKPSDLDASPHLIDVPEAIHKVGKDVHTATTTLMVGAYEKFVDAGAFGEKFLIDVCVKNLPKVFAPPFNLYDLIRQFFDGTVDIEGVGKPCDAVVAKAIRDLIKARPLTPCPGISVATYLADSDRWLPTVFTKEGDALMNRKSGFEYHKQFVTYLFTASNWEIDRWYHEHERMLQKAEEFGSESFKAMAMWIGSAVVLKYKYAAILKNSQQPGLFPRRLVEQFKADLRAMYKRDPSRDNDE